MEKTTTLKPTLIKRSTITVSKTFDLKKVKIEIGDTYIEVNNFANFGSCKTLAVDGLLCSCGTQNIDGMKTLLECVADPINAALVLNRILKETKTLAAFTVVSITQKQKEELKMLKHLATMRTCVETAWKKNPNTGNPIKVFIFS